MNTFTIKQRPANRVCPTCRLNLTPEAAVCPQCGASVPPGVQAPAGAGQPSLQQKPVQREQQPVQPAQQPVPPVQPTQRPVQPTQQPVQPAVRQPVQETRPVFCSQCGTKNDAQARFCKACGAKMVR